VISVVPGWKVSVDPGRGEKFDSPANGRDRIEVASHLVEHLVGLTTVRIDGTNQAVLCPECISKRIPCQRLLTRDILKMPSVLEPGPTGRDVISGTFALGLDKNRGIDNVLAVPRLERLEQLKTVRCFANSNLDGGSIARRCLEGVLARIVAFARELVTGRLGEFELLAIGALQTVGQGVEFEVAGKDESGNDLQTQSDSWYQQCKLDLHQARPQRHG